MNITPLWLVALGGLIVAPLVTWLPMLALKYPALGLPQYPPAQGIDLWSMQAFWLVMLGSFAVLVGQSDLWLGLAIAIAGLTVFLRGATMDPTHSMLLAIGSLLLVGIRQAPELSHRIIRVVLIALACVQAAYAVQQYFGYDLLWGPLLGATLIAHPQMLGTVGTVNGMAGILAIIAPLAPWPILIPLAAVVWLSHSLGAIAALLVGLAVRYRHLFGRRWYAQAAVISAGAGLLAWAASILNVFQQTHLARLAIWNFAVHHWARTDPILGYGLGGWGLKIPAFQQQLRFAPTPELWQEAHNEPLQWVVETGLVGLVLLVCWLYTHRHMVADPVWGASVAALAADTLTWFPFHIVPMALLGLLVVGVASRPKEPSCAAA